MVVNLSRVERVVAGVPYMKPEQARVITTKVVESGARDVLELGIMHGVSTCYMAEALEQSGRDWSITSLDREAALRNEPNVEDLLDRLGLRSRVTLLLEPRSYTWRLMKMLAEDPRPRFDFCYLDGAHSWDTDGFAFFLVDRLLRPGGWIVFDDLEWSYAGSPQMMAVDAVRALPADEQQARQVGLVFDLLVRPHPQYGEFAVRDGWGFAQKLATAADGPAPLRREYVVEQVGLGAVAQRVYRKARRRLREVRDRRSA